MRKIAIGLLVIFCCVAVKCTVGQTLRFTQIEKTSPVGAGSVVVTNTAGVLTYTTKLPSSVIPTLSAYVPYTGATGSVNLGANSFSTSVISFSTDGIAKQNSTTATSTQNGSWWLNSETTNGWQWYLNDATNSGYHTQWKNGTAAFGLYLANAGGTKVQLGSTTNDAVGMYVNGGSPKIRIATTGNVGINTSQDVTSTFSVSGDVGISSTATVAGAFLASSTATVTGNTKLTGTVQANGTVNIGAGTYGTDNLHQLRVTKGTGTVDIGQFTAGYGTIWAGVNTPAATNYAMASNGTNLVLNAPVSNIFMSVANGANLVNVNANTNYFIKPTRIGSTTAPTATLDVTGTMSVSSTFSAAGRVEQAQGASVASANNLALGADGNSFEITGTKQINLITNTNWQNGSIIRLLFTSTPVVKNAQETSDSNIKILLAGGVDFSATADDCLTLVLSTVGGVQAWREVSRSVN